MAELVSTRDADRFALSAVPAGRAIVHVKSWLPDAGALPSLVPAGVDARLLALGPGEWLMVSDSLDGPGLRAAVGDLARSHGMAAVDVSQGMAGLRVRGSAARDVLAMGSGLDLDPDSFPVGRCTKVLDVLLVREIVGPISDSAAISII